MVKSIMRCSIKNCLLFIAYYSYQNITTSCASSKLLIKLQVTVSSIISSNKSFYLQYCNQVVKLMKVFWYLITSYRAELHAIPIAPLRSATSRNDYRFKIAWSFFCQILQWLVILSCCRQPVVHVWRTKYLSYVM